MRELEVDGAVAEVQASEAEVRAVQPRVLALTPFVFLITYGYERHGLVIQSRVDGKRHYTNAMAMKVDESPPAAGLLMRFIASGS